MDELALEIAEPIPPPASYFDPGDSTLWYIVRMWLTSLVPSLVISFGVMSVLATFANPEELTPQFPPPASQAEQITLFAMLVVFSPAVETLMMPPILWALAFITTRPMQLAILSALVWAGLHSSMALAWGLVIAWPFYVFSRAYLAMRPYGRLKAIAVTACVHSLQNTLPAVAILNLPTP